MAVAINEKTINNWNDTKDILINAANNAEIDPEVLVRMCSFESGFSSTARPIASNSDRNKVAQYDGVMAISSAHGYGQIINDTWHSLMVEFGEKYGIENASSMTKSETNKAIYREDTALQMALFAELTNKNLQAVNRAGVSGGDPSTDVYALHNLGETGGIKFLRALSNDPNQRVDNVLSSNVISGNPGLYGNGSITIAEAYQNMQLHMNAAEVYVRNLNSEKELNIPRPPYDIKEYQEGLIRAGYDVEANGIFDERTKEATLDLQRSNYITANGKLDFKTLVALDATLSERNRNIISNIELDIKNSIESLQRLYNDLSKADNEIQKFAIEDSIKTLQNEIQELENQRAEHIEQQLQTLYEERTNLNNTLINQENYAFLNAKLNEFKDADNVFDAIKDDVKDVAIFLDRQESAFLSDTKILEYKPGQRFSVNEDVKLVQEFLNSQLNLNGEPYLSGSKYNDGKFGEKTEDAIKEYQRDNNLAQSGKIDEVLRAHIIDKILENKTHEELSNSLKSSLDNFENMQDRLNEINTKIEDLSDKTSYIDYLISQNANSIDVMSESILSLSDKLSNLENRDNLQDVLNEKEFAFYQNREFSSDKTISKDDIKIIQSFIGVKDDGVIGPKTLAAIEAYKEEHNIEPKNNIIDENLRAHIANSILENKEANLKEQITNLNQSIELIGQNTEVLQGLQNEPSLEDIIKSELGISSKELQTEANQVKEENRAKSNDEDLKKQENDNKQMHKI